MKFFSALGFVFAFGASVASAAPVGPERAVVEFLQSEMAERHIPGLQVAVIQNGKSLLSKAFGVASIQYGVPVSADSVFSINSATKSFTGVAVMQLVEQGKIDLQAPASRYLDDLPAAWQAVTVTQLLNHTSGLPDIIDPTTGNLPPGDADAAWTAVRALPMESTPGTRFSYNQTNYVVLEKIIALSSGEPFVRFIQRRQFDAAGMPNSGFGDSLDVVKNKANSYRLAGDGRTLRNVIEDFPSYTRAGAGINTNVADLSKWTVALQRGRLINSASLRQLWTPTSFADGAPAPWALGWPAIRRGEHRAVAGIGGARSAFYVYPEHDLAVIILTNLSGSQPEQLIDAVAGFYVPALRQVNGGGYAIHRLRQDIAKSGYADLDGKLQRVMARYAVSKPSQGALNSWGYRLLAKRETKPAIAVLELAVRLYPDDANAHDSLGEAYAADHANELAIKHYRRSLQLNPQNRNAAERLKVLGI